MPPPQKHWRVWLQRRKLLLLIARQRGEDNLVVCPRRTIPIHIMYGFRQMPFHFMVPVEDRPCG